MAYDIFAPFTGSPVTNAAQQQQQLFQNLQSATGQNIYNTGQQGLGYLQSGQQGALGAITGGFGTAAGNVGAATPQALAALYGGSGAATGALTDAEAQALGILGGGVGAATGAYAPVSRIAGQYTGYANQASRAQADALGLNGPEGIARSRAAFQTSPGYQFGVEQGTQGIARVANIGGMAAGGNTLAAAGQYVTNAADQEWNNYLAGLQARQGLYAPLGLSGAGTAAGGVANAALTGGTSGANIVTGTGGRLADILYGTGGGAAGIYTGQGNTLAQLASQGGLAQGNVYTGTGQSEADLLRQLTGLQTGFTQNIGGLMGQSIGAEGVAGMQGPTNLWNLGIAGAQLAAGIPKSAYPTGTVGGKAIF